MMVKLTDPYFKLAWKRGFKLDPGEVRLLNKLGVDNNTLGRISGLLR
jgi:hypothetical protein